MCPSMIPLRRSFRNQQKTQIKCKRQVHNVKTNAPTLEPAALTPTEPYVSGGIVSSSVEVMTNSPTEIALAEFNDNEDEYFETGPTTTCRILKTMLTLQQC